MDKKLMIIVVLLALYVIWIKPLNQKAQFIRFQIAATDKAIAKEKFISKQAKKIKKLYPIYEKTDKENKRIFFSLVTPVSTAMSKLQQSLKRAAKAVGIKITSLNWGEPIKKDGYLKLPLSFTLNGRPEQVSFFLERIADSKKLMRFEEITISKYSKNRLRFNAIVFGFKLRIKDNVKD